MGSSGGSNSKASPGWGALGGLMMVILYLILIPSTKSGHKTVHIPNSLMRWHGQGYMYGHRGEIFIAIDLDSGYWQVVAEKRQGQVGFLHTRLKEEVESYANGCIELCLNIGGNCDGAPAAVGWFGRRSKHHWMWLGSHHQRCPIFSTAETRDKEQLLRYFKTVLDILKHYRQTINLKKYKWFQDNCKYIGVNVGAKRNSLGQSKFEAFHKIECPQTRFNVRMLIGVFGFYIKHPPSLNWPYHLGERLKPSNLPQAICGRKRGLRLCHPYIQYGQRNTRTSWSGSRKRSLPSRS